jgi:molybdopterin-guanine dinucleotide biosynthesis protein A
VCPRAKSPNQGLWPSELTPWLLYYRPVGELAAFVLAGGKSSRMGADKIFLKLGGRTLLDRTLAIAKSVTHDVLIVGGQTKLAGLANVIEDLYPNCGPLGGIHAALTNSTAELNLMLAVDLPFLERRFLEYLLSAARQSNATVTVPRADGGFQSLCAIYRRPFAELAECALRTGNNKIDRLFVPADTRVLEEYELKRSGFSPEMFRNVNTPEDWEQTKSTAHLKS